MALLSVNRIKKSFGDFTLFENISFEVDSKDHIGFVGANGCGKTTILNMLSGRDAPDGGAIYYGSETVIGFVQQHADSGDSTLFEYVLSVFSELIHAEEALADISQRLSVAAPEELDRLIMRQHRIQDEYESNGGMTYRSRTRSVLLGLGFSDAELARPLSSFSGGQRNKAQLARLLLSNANLLLLDEPTNHLDIESVEWLEDFLCSYNHAFIVVSHDRYFLDKVTTKTMELKSGELFVSRGNYSAHMEKRATAKEIALKHYRNTQREIRRIYGIVEQQKRWNQERNYVTIASKLKQIERLKATLVEPENELATIQFGFSANELTGNDVIIAADLKKRFDKNEVLSGVDMHVLKGERIFLLGPNGCGKTTLLKILAGILKSDGGTFSLGARVRPGYYDQTLSQLSPENTVLNEVWGDHYARLSHTQIRNALAAFLFRTNDDVQKQVSCLSGGEKARLQLLKLILSDANLLLLDEPTNHLDIASRNALENALDEYKGAMLIVTHDRYLVNRLADRVFYMQDGRLECYTGNYDDFVRERSERKAAASEEKPASAAGERQKNAYRLQKEHTARINRQNGEISRIEAKIELTEEQLAELNEKLASPEIACDYVKAGELAEETEQLKAKLRELYEAWEEAQKQLELLKKEN